MATTLLDLLRQSTILDIDANEESVTKLHGPFQDMTSNQAIVLNELKKPQHQEIISQSVIQAVADVDSGAAKQEEVSQLAVDWMTVKLGLRVLPHLHVEGHVHAQTLPSLAYDTAATVAHALQLVNLYSRSGIASSRVCIKIPSTLEGLRACKILQRDHNVRTLATTVFSIEQALAAAEDAKCIYAAPYLNPLRVHFVKGTHIAYENPVKEMPGLKVTAQIQREYRKRKLSTQLMAASLVTAEEALSTSGVDRVTLSPAVLDLLANIREPFDPKFIRIHADAIEACSPTYQEADADFSDVHISLEEPASDLRAALEREYVKQLMDEALFHFKNAEEELLILARKSMGKQ
ncbi:hypothetical protein FRC02_011390 [Tulasnella sp. 418]|nr:hypothetical protein FRC02_011390 [Tulasnella sp. 418]